MSAAPATYRIPAYRVSLVRDGSTVGEGRPYAKVPADAVRIFRGVADDDGNEHFKIALLDVRRKVTGVIDIASGCMTQSLVHPREVFAPAIVHKAAAIVLCHNHPSGDPEPSAEDIALTRRLASCGTLLGVEVLDHIILGDGTERHVSLKDRGLL